MPPCLARVFTVQIYVNASIDGCNLCRLSSQFPLHSHVYQNTSPDLHSVRLIQLDSHVVVILVLSSTILADTMGAMTANYAQLAVSESAASPLNKAQAEHDSSTRGLVC